MALDSRWTQPRAGSGAVRVVKACPGWFPPRAQQIPGGSNSCLTSKASERVSKVHSSQPQTRGLGSLEVSLSKTTFASLAGHVYGSRLGACVSSYQWRKRQGSKVLDLWDLDPFVFAKLAVPLSRRWSARNLAHRTCQCAVRDLAQRTCQCAVRDLRVRLPKHCRPAVDGPLK